MSKKFLKKAAKKAKRLISCCVSLKWEIQTEEIQKVKIMQVMEVGNISALQDKESSWIA